MSEMTEQKVASLLQQGLELYGTGDVGKAFVLWGEVLELEPGNEEALDYMRDADRRVKPRGVSPQVGDPSIVEQARRLVHGENVEGAFELLTSSPLDGGLEAEAMVELLRATLFQRYRGDLGDSSWIPRIVDGEAAGLQTRNLPPAAGFLLSMIDGMTSLSDLLSVSGMDCFEVLRVIHRLHEAGILESDG
ncbi:MAG: hypothetical protein CL908_13185 [Deltaproteobacteria bacterium]|nr:hypothetical protein [Deltaproteobacteria bacterium]